MARTTKGSIYLRGKNYYLLYYVNGVRTRVSLKDESGQPITNQSKTGKARARAAADLILYPLTVKQTAERLEKVSEALATAEQKAEAAELEAANSKAAIANGWELFYSCPKRPKSCRKYAIDEIPRTSTAANYRAYFRKFSAWMQKHHKGTRLLADVTETQALEFIEQVKKENASGTVNKYLQFLKCFYETLISAGKITCKNPFADLEREEHTYNSKKPLTIEQIANLLDNAEGELKILFALGYFTGLRRGDCCTLLWSEVDLLRGVIERIPNKIAGRVKDPSQAVVKVGIAPLLGGLLAETPAPKRRGYVLPEMANLYTTGKDYTITTQIAAHFQRCGIETRLPGTGSTYRYDGKKKVYDSNRRAVVQYGFHSLRYSYISHNAALGTPQAIIQRNAGHANPAMTEHYIKISDDTAKQYAAKLQLPGADDQPDAADDEPERAELKALADTLTIEEIRNILAGMR
ncbi:MAG TPA: tyrosine-type recombinase/integrase [Anaerohalosphaeraceae bacterium]|nr:tyrosine-type recombinase/integrase [Anaerohalosphaeraceae bacterium]